MNFTSTLGSHLHSAPVTIDDVLARKLMKKADDDDCLIEGRHFEIRQQVGNLYGAPVYAGSRTKKRGTSLVLVCRGTVTYTENDL